MSQQIVTYHPAASVPAAIKAMPPLVELAGKSAPWLEPLEIVRSTGSTLNRARLRIHRHTPVTRGRSDDLAEMATSGTPIRISWRFYDPWRSRVQTWPLFSGVVQGGNSDLGDQEDHAVLEACSKAALGANRQIEGIRLRTEEGSNAYLSGSTVVFNPDGRPNATEGTGVNKSYPVFELNQQRAVYWTYATAITYLVREYLQSYNLYVDTSLAMLETLTAGRVLRNVNVTGLAPLEAIGRLCGRVAIGYALELAALSNGEVISCLKFFSDGRGLPAYLCHQKPGEKLDLDQTNVQILDLQRRPHYSFHVSGFGGYRRFESTFELVRAWDAAKEVNDYDLYSPTSNPDFVEVQDVFRKWTLNEAGDYSPSPYNRGDAYDLSEVFQTTAYAARRRRFWPCLSRTGSGESMGYYLEVSYNSGLTWHKYPGAFDNLLDECGVYLTFDTFSPEMWIAIKKDMLCFRITATVVSDERISAEIHDGPIRASRPVHSATSHFGEEFRYQQVTPSSVFYGSSTLGAPDVVDDGAALRSRLRDHLLQQKQHAWRGTATIPFVRPDLWPGQVVGGIEGRGFDLRQFLPRSEGPQIRTVTLRFGNAWSTQLEFGGDLTC